MSTTISLHHVGEVLLRGLLARLAERGRLEGVSCRLHEGCNLSAVLADAAVDSPLRFDVNVPLAPVELAGKRVLFDGAHGVDVLCHDGKRGLGIEAKLGLDRLASATFTERFLGPLKLSTHKAPRFTGSMTAILNYRSLGGGDVLPLRTKEPAVELAPPWFLVVRRSTWRSWGNERPELLNAHVALFEDIAAAYGSGGDFDKLVLDVVGDGFHAAWKVNE